MGRVRTQSERDAATVEMTCAVVTGALMAAAGFVAVISPVLYGVLHGEARKGCFTGAVVVATALFCGRVAFTLRRFERRNRLRAAELTPDQEPAEAAEPAEPDALPRVPRQRSSGHGSARGKGAQAPDQPSQPGRTNPDS
jgi:Family of unknown function (DUF6332)